MTAFTLSHLEIFAAVLQKNLLRPFLLAGQRTRSEIEIRMRSKNEIQEQDQGGPRGLLPLTLMEIKGEATGRIYRVRHTQRPSRGHTKKDKKVETAPAG